MTVLLYVLAFILLIIGISFILPVIRVITPPIPSTSKVNKLLIKKIRELDSSSGDIVDIGSGYGTTVLALSRAFPDRRVVASEISFFPLFFSRVMALLLCRKNIKFEHGDGFSYVKEHKEVRCVFIYLLMTKGVRNSLRELSKRYNGLLFLNTYPYPDCDAQEILLAGDLFKSCLYVYDMRKKDKRVAKAI